MIVNLTTFDSYLRVHVSHSNRRSIMRVMRKLVSGEGIAHRSRPGERFLAGHPLCLSDDLEEVRAAAAEWLPYRKNDPNCLDKGHGWALNHPLVWLIKYRNALVPAHAVSLS